MSRVTKALNSDLCKGMTLVQCFAKDRFATSFLCAPERSSPSYGREARNV